MKGLASASIRAWLGASVVVAAAAAGALPWPAAWVESAYANGLHPVVQHVFTRATNLLPFALGDLVIAAAVLALPVAWTVRLRAAGRGRRLRAARGLAGWTLVAAAGAYLIFLALWGLCYRRLPIASKVDYDAARVTADSARALAARTIASLNEDGAAAHAAPWPDAGEVVRLLAPTFDAAAMSAGDRGGIVPARPKTSLGDAFLGASGTSGFTNPVTHEVVLDRTILDVERPFLLAHEWGHLAGFADESEASFVGLLACARSPSPAIRYSGWLALYETLPSGALGAAELPPAEGTAASGAAAGAPAGAPAGEHHPPELSAQVRDDLRAIAERASRRRSRWISLVSTRAYDRFLKANRVAAGVASYGLVVQLVLGTRFDEPWVPAPRAER